MKLALPVAFLLVLAVVAVAPAAEAKPYCTSADWSCPGSFCLWDRLDREWDPCLHLCPYDCFPIRALP